MIQTLPKTIKHQAPSLSAELIGALDEEANLALFRGIPYASVDKRWTHSKTKDNLESPFDATAFGPRCVQGEGQVLVSGGTNDPVPGDHEFDCLNLNIAVPVDTLQSLDRRPIPVMVWIHGGAFNYGANSVGRYRPSKLCSIAAAAGKPIILVQIGYRLGPLGFAASSDLASEADQSNSQESCQDTNPKMGSYGFVDQRNAFEWVRDHISDFGGDPDDVTAFGVSAGSASVHFHILTGSPLFDRAIMMSGAAPTLGPLPLQSYEDSWTAMNKRLNLTENSPKARLEYLRNMKPEEIIDNYSKAAMGPWGDGNLLPSSWDFKDATPTRCKTMILGDTSVEAIILDGLFKSIPQPTFRQLAQSTFSTEDAKGFADAFGFSLVQDQSVEDYIKSMRHFFSVMMFQFSNIGIAETKNAPYDAYLYHFEEPSPYPGPTHGVAYHGQCALYMHNNDVEQYPPSGKRVAEEMALMWTAFAHGQKPWEPYSTAHRFMRFGPGEASTMHDFQDDNTRDYAYLGWLREHRKQAQELARRILQGEGRKS